MFTTDHIGCRASAVKVIDDIDATHLTGVIRAIAQNNEFCLIEYDEDIGADCGGHDEHGNQVAEPGHCMWVRSKYVKLESSPYRYNVASKVQKDFEHKGMNLKDLPFRVLGYTSKGRYAVVEFEEDVRGHSGDGLGKKGHCLHIPIKVIQKEK